MRKALEKCQTGVDADDLGLVLDGLSELSSAIDMYYISQRSRWDPLFWTDSPMQKALEMCQTGVDADDLGLVLEGLSELTAAIDMYYVSQRSRWAECLFAWAMQALMWGLFFFFFCV